MSKVAIILGTRPEIIKLASLINEFKKNNTDFTLIHSNQHYSKNMDSLFFEELNLPLPDHNLGVGSASHAEQTSKILSSLDDLFSKNRPSLIIVHGDTNTTLGGALYASKVGVPIAHVEAGLRSYDRGMPEEINRVITDHVSKLLFAPTQETSLNLLKEGVNKSKIHVVGNTIADAIRINSKKVGHWKNKSDYVLVTVHRPANVDIKENIFGLLEILKSIRDLCNHKIIFPIHPRTLSKLKHFNLLNDFNSLDVDLIDPVGYFRFLELQKNAKCIVTDSGGIQEEACILGVPCITLRENTERPETISVGSNYLVGLNNSKFREIFERLLNSDKKYWANPFGDGYSGRSIFNILEKEGYF
ncbi:MAG: UDP-N-acetylglucosamine 2-epimerase (non-hydrolyzing) [Bdellovibrionaceae bacterium]|nr:UDP-N-acetylglucosamine 2-epimerase (non-hydrolyzing) [Pseudobdellovibrionaceae bacterium]